MGQKKCDTLCGGEKNMQVLEKSIRNISSCNNKYAHDDGTNFDDVTSLKPLRASHVALPT